MSVRVHLLGQVSIESDEAIVPASLLPGRQGRLAFAYLAVARQPVARDELAEVVWRDELPKSWERDLSAVISKLKAPLAKVGLPDALHSALGCYELELPADAVLDVAQVSVLVEEAEAAIRRDLPDEAWGAATTAIHLARRPFIPGESGPWVDSVRADQLALFLRATDALVAVAMRRGRWGDAERLAEEAIARAPFRESSYVALVDVHVGAGNRAEALRAYERARSLLAEELGVPPSAPLEAAYRRALDADGPAAPAPAPTQADGAITGTVTLLFTDLVDSTALMDRLSADEAEAVRRTHFRLLRDAVVTTGGREVKNLGDGLMVAFPRARDALACGVAIQEAIDANNRDTPGMDLAVRVGIHAGEPTVEDGDYFGLPVAVAKRLCDVAAGGEILASDLVCTLADASDELTVGPLEPLELKGVAAPVPARRIGWRPLVDAARPLPAVVRVADDDFAFVGRSREVADLVNRCRPPLDGPALVVVSGEPGVGKTRLLAEAAVAVHGTGATVLWGRCAEEPLGAFQPFIESLEPVVASLPVHELRVVLGQGASDLARILPRVAERLPAITLVEPAEDADRQLLFEAVSRCIGGLAVKHPVVLVVDDLHWADGPSMQLLTHLLRNPGLRSLVVLASVRAGTADWSADATEAYADLVRTERLTRIELSGLDEPAVTELLGLADHRMHPEGFSFARALQASTAGNPFFIREVIRHLNETGRLRMEDGRLLVDDPHAHLDVPGGVRAVVARRLARLSEPARELLTLAAVIGNDFDVPLLMALTAKDDDQVLDLLEEAIAAQLVVEPQGGIDRFTFTHAIVRDALHDGIGPSRRSRHHRRVAEALEQLAGDDRIAELAHHWCAAGPAGDIGRAVDCARRAGEVAQGQLAYEDAANHFAAALAACRSAEPLDGAVERDLLLSLGQARALASDERAVVTFLEAAGLARTAGDHVTLARAVLGLTGRWLLTGVVDEERIQLIEEALAALGDRLLPERAALLGRLAGDLYYAPDTRERREQLAATAVGVARQLGDPVILGTALSDRNYAMWRPGGERDRLAAGCEIVEAAEAANDPDLELQGLGWIMIASAELGEVDEFARALARYERTAGGARRPRQEWYASTRRAALTILRGDFDDGVRLTHASMREGRRLGEPDAVNVVTGMLWPVWLERPGQGGETFIRENLDAMQAAGAPPDSLGARVHRLQLTVLLAQRGEAAAAADQLAPFRGQGVDDLPDDYARSLCAALVCGAVALIGSREEAIDRYGDCRQYDGTMAANGVMWAGLWSHHLGRLAVVAGREDAAEQHLTAAVERYELIGAPTFGARAQVELGTLVHASGDEARARELATAALGAARRLGLPLVQRDAEALVDRLSRRG